MTSSSTLSEISGLQHQAYKGKVSIDTSSPYSGTEYPVGTSKCPVNNLEDARGIAATYGISVLEDCTRFNRLLSDIKTALRSVEKSIQIPKQDPARDVLYQEFVQRLQEALRSYEE